MNNDMVNQKILITQEGLDHLKQELDDIVKRRRPAAVIRIATAREQGDLSENSEYAAAKDDLSFIDGRIIELEEIIQQAKVFTPKSKNGKVDFGSKVAVHIDGRKDVFTIVGEWEANPKEKKISHSSPLGKALIGKAVGEVIEVEAPAGKIIYKIVKID